MVVRVLLVATVAIVAACGGGDGASTKADTRPDSAAPPSSVASATPAAGAAAPKAKPQYPYHDITWLDSLVDSAIDFERPATVDQIPGSSSHCWTFARHWLVTTPDEGEPALSDIIVRSKPGATACGGADSVTGDFVIRDTHYDDFLALNGDWLFVTGGNAEAGALVIYDLAARTRVGQFAGDVAGWRDSTHLLLWMKGGPAQRSQCRQVAADLDLRADSLFALDLRTKQLVSTKRWRCAVTQ